MRSNPIVKLLAISWICIGAAACTDVKLQPAPLLSTASVSVASYTLETSVEAKPPNGKSRSLAAGSHWTQIGSIAEGTVYKPHGTVLTVESVNVSEADIVVHDGAWVGFWLPVERAFVPTEKAASLELRPEE
jgi:hypothetical protein